MLEFTRPQPQLRVDTQNVDQDGRITPELSEIHAFQFVHVTLPSDELVNVIVAPGCVLNEIDNEPPWDSSSARLLIDCALYGLLPSSLVELLHAHESQ
ncbi:MAG: hypothetical protein QOK10_2810 [Pseudonocardiales bacterium]|jgi:hypothetical protein|nr:hypothetical protein [Pseudonocardiales bacterium]